MLVQGILGFFLGKTIANKICGGKANAQAAENTAPTKDTKAQEAEENELVEVQAEDGNWVDTAKGYKDQMGRITEKSFSKSGGFWGFFNMMDHMGGTVMSQGFDPNKMEDITDSNAQIQESKAEGPQVLESTLPEEKQKEAREYAIKLLEEQLNENKENMPDYGDVRSYYNEGSLFDWVVSHPVSFAANWVAEKTGADWYTTFSQEWLGKDGMFTIFNIPTYIENGIRGESDVRRDNYTDMLGNIKTEEDLKEYVASREKLIEDLKANIDNPEKFAETYYYATEGVNFSADNVMEYKKTVEEEEKNGVKKEDQTKPSVGLIGRNYLAEDIKKNEIATNAAYEINKTVGTKLCDMIPFVGPLVAGVVNVGVTALEEKTQDDSTVTKGEWTKIILKEGIGRNLVVNGIGKIISKIFGGGGGLGSTALGSGMQSSVDSSIDATGNIIDGNTGGLIGNGVEAGTGWKAVLKTGLKSAGKWFIGLFKK